MENRSKQELQERDALLKQAFCVIMELDDDKLKELLERMGFNNEAN